MWQKCLTMAVAALLAMAVASPVVRAADELHEGQIISVGEAKLTLLDKRDGDNDTFTVTAETKITRNGKPAKLSDVQLGDQAKVTATSRGGMLVAKVIVAIEPE